MRLSRLQDASKTIGLDNWVKKLQGRLLKSGAQVFSRLFTSLTSLDTLWGRVWQERLFFCCCLPQRDALATSSQTRSLLWATEILVNLKSLAVQSYSLHSSNSIVKFNDPLAEESCGWHSHPSRGWDFLMLAVRSNSVTKFCHRALGQKALSDCLLLFWGKEAEFDINRALPKT